MLGLMLGTGAAFAREHMNTAITRNDEIETALRVPNLAVIPHLDIAPIIRSRKGQRRLLPFFNGRRDGRALVHRPLEELITVVHGRSSGAEAYRTLRTNLMFARSGAGLKRILVSSAIAAEGKSTTASNLAVTYAQQGLRVLLIDGDLRKSRLHTIFGVPREPGLTELLLGTAKPVEVIHATGVPGLSLLTAGTLPPNPSELLGGPRTRKLLDTLQETADIIVIDAPPVLVAGDASILGLMSDGVVIVVRAGTTDRAAARTAVRQLQGVGAPIIGAILNDPDAKVQHEDSNYYYYAYYGEGKEKG
jgi:tyrosine-protein kinase Etk/Wzc